MTFEPHLRLTMNGEIGGGQEIFSMMLSLAPDGGILGQDVANYLASEITQGIFDDIVQDCVDYFKRVDTQISPHARLLRVKLAHINADGHYAGNPLEAAVSQAGSDGYTAAQKPCGPWQISRKVTLLTDGDLGRVKGGFYLPCPVAAPYDAASDLWSVDSSNEVEASTATFLNALANEPNLDVLDLKPVVASQGRHNKNGSVRLAPDNHEVTGISVGRRPDVQRRRANRVLENRTTPQDVNF